MIYYQCNIMSRTTGPNSGNDATQSWDEFWQRYDDSDDDTTPRTLEMYDYTACITLGVYDYTACITILALEPMDFVDRSATSYDALAQSCTLNLPYCMRITFGVTGTGNLRATWSRDASPDRRIPLNYHLVLCATAHRGDRT